MYFPFFILHGWRKKIRYPAADDLFRVSFIYPRKAGKAPDFSEVFPIYPRRGEAILPAVGCKRTGFVV